MKTEEGNKLIAEFCNLKSETEAGVQWYKDIDEDCSAEWQLTDLQFHASWDWLMPVVEKIENIQGVGAVVISRDHCWISDDKEPADNENIVPANLMRKNKIEAVWLAVVEFIKWNNQKQQL